MPIYSTAVATNKWKNELNLMGERCILPFHLVQKLTLLLLLMLLLVPIPSSTSFITDHSKLVHVKVDSLKSNMGTYLLQPNWIKPQGALLNTHSDSNDKPQGERHKSYARME